MYRRPLLAATASATAAACVGAAPSRATNTPHLDVEFVEMTTDLEGGDRFDVTVRLENTGDAAGEDRGVVLRVGGDFLAVDSTRVSLAPGEATEVTLGYDTYPVQVDVEFPIRVETVDDAVERTITVTGADRDAEGDMAVDITDVADEGVHGGETLQVSARFENTGETKINTVAQLVSVGKGAVVNEAQIVLDPGEVHELIFGYRTYPVETDVTFEMAVCTPYDSDVATVSVAARREDYEAGPFGVSIFQTEDPVTGGEELTVVAEFVNAGSAPGSFTAELVVGDEVVDRREVEMPRESTVIRSFGYETYPVKVDVEFPVTVRTPDDSATAQVVVHGTEERGAGEATSSTGAETTDGDGDESANAGETTDGDGESDAEDDGGEKSDRDDGGAATFDVSIDGTTAPVTGGDRLNVTATVTNSGAAVGEATAELVVGGEVVDTQDVSVAAAGSQTLTLGYATYPVEQDVEFPVTVRVDGASDSTTVRVHGTGGSSDSDDAESNGGGSPSLSVDITGTTAPVDAGDRLDVTATVSNGGDAAASETAALVVGGETVDTQSVSIPAGALQTVTLGYATYPVEQDVTFPVTVRVGAASASTSVAVRGGG